MANSSHNTNLRRKHPAVANSFQWESNDLGSGLIARLGGRPFLGFVSIVLFLLLLSFACEKALGSVGWGTSEASTAAEQDADIGPVNDQSGQTSAAPQTGVDGGSGFFEVFLGGLTQKCVLITYDRVLRRVNGGASVGTPATQWDADSASRSDNPVAQTAVAPHIGADSESIFFEEFPGGLAQKCVLIIFDQVVRSVNRCAYVAIPEPQQDADSAPLNFNSAQSAAAQTTGNHAGSSSFDAFGEGAALHGGDLTWRDNARMLAFRLTIAAVLGAVLAFRPRRFSPSRHRNPCVVQTQRLLSIVACALMMIVGDSAARAFGIFAAASLVRYRTSIRDPKEITVLLVALGVGLAAGVGRWELATMFTLFVLVVLELLESYEHQQAVRMMELSVKTHDVETTDDALRELFKRNNLDIDIKELNKQSEKHPVGKVVYSVDLGPKVDTERLAAEIYLADPVNIDRVEWLRKKAPSVANGT
jgi:uncharacterized membrane protein YhiD involved in acid resistance